MAQVEHTGTFLDVTPYISGNPTVPIDPVSKLPMIVVMLPLEPGTVWHARVLPMITHGLDDNRAWSHVAQGTHVRIPLFPYRLSGKLSEAMMGVIELTQSMAEACPGAKRTHIIVGDPVQDLSNEGKDNYRVWIGFAARMQ